jgi:hypothetical protein
MAECYNSLLLFGKFFLFWYNWTKKNLATLDRRTCADKTRTEKNATDNFFREIKIVGSLLFLEKTWQDTFHYYRQRRRNIAAIYMCHTELAGDRR